MSYININETADNTDASSGGWWGIYPPMYVPYDPILPIEPFRPINDRFIFVSPPVSYPSTEPNKGWECSKCGKSWSPKVDQCYACNNK